MSFFDHQNQARKNTRRLVFLYFLSVICIILSVFAALSVCWMVVVQAQPPSDAEHTRYAFDASKVFFAVTAFVLSIVGIGTAVKIYQLSTGGRAVAELLGGRLLDPNSQEANERRLLNVVEEVAIASGVPVPPVYVLLEEQAINAFAAGFSLRDAVIGITQGTLDNLNRDELQGVVAHEFSHILNGDMRLNIRLIGVLNGILFIALTGYWFMRIAGQLTPRRNSKNNGLPLAFIATGFVMFVVGYIGVFFANLIKSAISRQREFLADASAVQFTRNPNGIAGALKKIAEISSGSRLASAKAEEASHMYFASGIKSAWMKMLSTHPPISERLKKIGALGISWTEPESELGFNPSSGSAHLTPDLVSNLVGAPSAQHMSRASSLIAEIPLKLQSQVRTPVGACVVVYGLLLSPVAADRKVQLSWLEQNTPPTLFAEINSILPLLAGLRGNFRLPLVELSAPALQQISGEDYRTFRSQVLSLINADSAHSVFEYALTLVLLRTLDTHFGLMSAEIRTKSDLEKCRVAARGLLHALVSLTQVDQLSRDAAFMAGLKELEDLGSAHFVPVDSTPLSVLDGYLQTLLGAPPDFKKLVVKSCAASVISDGKVSVDEEELLRAVCGALECPVPLLHA